MTQYDDPEEPSNTERLNKELGMRFISRDESDRMKPMPETGGKKPFRGRLEGRDAIDVLTAGRALVGLRKLRPSEEDVIISNTGPLKRKWEYGLYALTLNEDGCLSIAPHLVESITGAVSGMAETFDITKVFPVTSHRFGVVKRLTVMLDRITETAPPSDAKVFEIFIWDSYPDCTGRILFRPPPAAYLAPIDADKGKVVTVGGVPVGKLLTWGYVDTPAPLTPYWEVSFTDIIFNPTLVPAISAMALIGGSAAAGTSMASIQTFYDMTIKRVLYRKALAPTTYYQLVIEEEIRTEYLAKNLGSVQEGYPDVIWAAVRMSGGAVNTGYTFRVMLHSGSQTGDAGQAAPKPTQQTWNTIYPI